MLENVLLVISILLIVIVLLQGNKATDAGQVIIGGQDGLFANTKERGLELVVTRLTLILGIAFFVVSLILFLK
jgi:preprotein translocase subunit SecG